MLARARSAAPRRPAGRPVFRAVVLAAPAAAQIPAFRRLEVMDGLAHGRVTCIHPDSLGYVWIGTWEGLSRFDGVEFSSYGTTEGLPNPLVSALAEQPTGRLWIGTHGGGLLRVVERETLGLERGVRACFEPVALPNVPLAQFVHDLVFDSAGALWCGTSAGLFRCDDPGRLQPAFSEVALGDVDWVVADPLGAGVWAGIQDEVLHADRATVERRAAPDPGARMVAARADRQGILVATANEVHALESSGWRRLPAPLGPEQALRDVLRDGDGTLWLATSAGLVRQRGESMECWDARAGLPEDILTTLARDGEGHLWVGGSTTGALCFSASAITNWTHVEGEALRSVMWLVEARDGAIVASTDNLGCVSIQEHGSRWIEGSRDPPFRNVHMRLSQDLTGEWWIGTDAGLFRAPGPDLDLERAERVEPDQGGPAGPVSGTIHQAAAGRTWLGSDVEAVFGFERERDGSLTSRSLAFDAPSLGGFPRTFWTDATGCLWVATFNGIARWNGTRFELLSTSDGLPSLHGRCLFEDSRGRLWVGTRQHGVSMTEEPTAPAPPFRRWTTHEGLPSDAVWSVAESAGVRLWVATSRGLCLLDPAGGPGRVLGEREGLAGELVWHVIRDRSGRIWAATSSGVSCIDPSALEDDRALPPTRFTRVDLAGDLLPLPLRGSTSMELGSVERGRGRLLIEWAAPRIREARSLCYQHRLVGADGTWSRPAAARSVRYAVLGPGSYRFEVRAVDPGGTITGAPAILQLTVLPPLWQRGWVLASAAAALVALALAFHRARVARLLALERVRRQIATDVHDELGSGLAQIAVLSEVARREPSETIAGRLAEIARLARTMRESMADIVWAIDPRRDSLADLMRRVRQVTENLLASEGGEVTIEAPEDAEDVQLAPNTRRHAYLFAKEALTNVARHAGAARALVQVKLDGGAIRLAVQDDGRGFDPAAATAGHGTHGMRQRAEALGGRCAIASRPGAGTQVELVAPRQS